MIFKKPRTFDGKIGFEIECVFKLENRELIQRICSENRWIYSSDPSISCDRTHRCSAEIKFHYSIDELNQNAKKINKLFKLIKSNGIKYHCGGHIHLSFKESLDYFKLCNFEFVSYFQESYKKYAKTRGEKARINTGYAQNYQSKEHFIRTLNYQLSSPDKSNRYYCINFNSFNIHNTIEFRVFEGTANINKLMKNVNFIFDTIDKFEFNPINIIIDKDEPKKNDKIVIELKNGFSKNKIITHPDDGDDDDEDDEDDDEDDEDDDDGY